jgi:hypothetical protein
MTSDGISTKLVGYQVRTAGGDRVVGEVEGVRANGMRLHKLAGHPRHHGYLPAEAVATVDERTNTIFLRDGIDASKIVDAPPPPNEDPEDWHKSPDWWADLLGHYGLYESEGRGNEPFLHPAQR